MVLADLVVSYITPTRVGLCAVATSGNYELCMRDDDVTTQAVTAAIKSGHSAIVDTFLDRCRLDWDKQKRKRLDDWCRLACRANDRETVAVLYSHGASGEYCCHRPMAAHLLGLKRKGWPSA